MRRHRQGGDRLSRDLRENGPGRGGDVDVSALEAVVLPGGLPGTHNLEASPAVQACVDGCVEQGKLVSAPSARRPPSWPHKGLLAGRNATAFPNFQQDLTEGGALLSDSYVVRDGQFLTGRGMGVATQFGLALVAALVSEEKAAEIRSSIQWEE